MLKKLAFACTISISLSILAGCAADNSSVYTHTNHIENKNEPAAAGSYTLDAEVSPKDGVYYLEVDTTFKLTDENYGGSPKEGEGHIHFYLNEKLIGPITSEDPYLLENLQEGTNTIKLDLANHDHSVIGVSKELSFENK